MTGKGVNELIPDGPVQAPSELRLSIAVDLHAKRVVIDLGTPLKWFTLDPAKAREFADIIKMKAAMAEGPPPPDTETHFEGAPV